MSNDSFMVPEIHECSYVAIECNLGETSIVPDFVCSSDRLEDYADYVEGGIDEDQELTRRTGFVYRMQAPGYLDCTEWSMAETEREALSELLDMEGNQEEPEFMESWEIDVRSRILAIDGLGRFECVEHSSGFEVKDRITGETHWMDDGVSFHDGLEIDAGSSGESVPDIGSEEFRFAWEEMLNIDETQTLEAYFPDQYEREND